jgi:hypothetical protein
MGIFSRLMRIHTAPTTMLVAAIAACGDRSIVTAEQESSAERVPVVARDQSALFQTDSLHYTLRASPAGYQATIGVAFTNKTGRTAYIVNCNGSTSMVLERLVDGRWRSVWSPLIPLCLSAPITVAAGLTYQTRIGVFGGYPESNVFPKFDIPDPTGVYRAVWRDVLSTYQDRLPFGDPLPLESRISNRFSLTAARR